MKLKLLEDGKVELRDGLPVYVHDDGKEIPFDAKRALDKITTLNTESKTWREKAESLSGTAKAFEGLDPDAARKALQTVSALEGDKAKFNDTLEKVKAEVNSAWTEKYGTLEAEYVGLKKSVNDGIISNAFRSSKVTTPDRVVIPVGFIESQFKGRFKVENGQPVAVGHDGNPVYSRRNPGALADFDEALEMFIESHPDRDSIWKTQNKPGSKTKPNSGNTDGVGAKQITRQQYKDMSPAEAAAHFQAGGTIID